MNGMDEYRIDPERALPTEAYRSERVYEMEQQRVWRGGWVFVGTADQVPEPGDYYTGAVLDQEIFLIRAQDREIRAFYNVCSHRGMPLVREEGPVAGKIRCSYHSWTYDLTGERLLQATLTLDESVGQGGSVRQDPRTRSSERHQSLG